MSKPHRAGGEVDAWCTRCKLDLGHRIVAMEGSAIKRVECLSCKGQHNYRAPKATDAAAPKSRGAPATKKARAAAPASKRVSRADQLRQGWERAIAGRSAGDFSLYRIDAQFVEGQLVRHKKFGDGVVATVLDPGKVEVLFAEGTKVLAQGQAAVR